MKMKLQSFPTLVAALFAVNLAGTPTLMAADPPPATPAPPTTTPAAPPPGEPGGPGRSGGRGGDRNIDRNGFQNTRPPNFGFGLDEKQRELYREASQKDSEELRKLEDKLRAAQKELVHAVLAEKYDEKAAREKAEAVAKLQTEITLLRAKALATVAPTLKPEQREQLENSPMAAALLNSGGVGFRAAGMGGPGGFGGGGPGGPDGGYRGGTRGRDGQPQPGGDRRRPDQ